MGCSSSNEDVTTGAVRGNPAQAVGGFKNYQLGKGNWGELGAATIVKVENRGKMVKAFLGKCSDDDKAMLMGLFD